MILLEFYRDDLPKTLFPLNTNLWLIERGLQIILNYIYQEIKSKESSDSGDFQQQERVFASKHNHHLRRTHKLDFVSEIFIYDIVYRHRSKFRKDFDKARCNFGYRFEEGTPISSSLSYKQYRLKILEKTSEYKFSLSFDISSYFNSIYHHDLSSWFRDIAIQDSDTDIFGKFLRQINGGRSIDCLTQGLYPTKMIGSHFLKFIDNFPGIKSPCLLRFMDDFVLFSNNLNELQKDFILIQKLLGRKGLSVNPSKTKFNFHQNHSVTGFLENQIDVVRLGLLRKRSSAFQSLYSDPMEEEDENSDDSQFLTTEETNYLLNLLDSPNFNEDDADLVLTYLRDEAENLLEHLSAILWRFPYLSKNVFLFVRFVEDKQSLLKTLLDFVNKNDVISDYSLFWIANIVETYLMGKQGVDKLISELIEHPDASKISKAKILEIPDHRYGLREYREEILRSGASDWLSWSSAVGSRTENRDLRNYVLKYFAKGSRINALIAEIISQE